MKYVEDCKPRKMHGGQEGNKNKSIEKKEQELKDREGDLRKTAKQLNDREKAVREAEYQMQQKSEQQSLEISGWDKTLQKRIDHLNQIEEKIEQVSKESNSCEMALEKAKKEQEQIARDVDARHKNLANELKGSCSLSTKIQKRRNKN